MSDGATQQLAEFDESHNPLEWNGNVIVTGDALSGKTDFFRNLEASASSEYIDLRVELKKRVCRSDRAPSHDGSAAGRIIKAVFGGGAWMLYAAKRSFSDLNRLRSHAGRCCTTFDNNE